jgi:hypothetical protein
MTRRPLPVALFAYNRPDHLERCLEDLAANPESTDALVRVFVDGPKTVSDLALTDQIVDVASRDYRSFSAKVVLRGRNLGLAGSVISGVSEMVEEFGEVIVVEDDLRLSPYFLRFMKDGLDTYREVDAVYSIHGYTYPVTEQLPETFFLRGADCWGWATWARSWKRFEPDAGALLRRLRTAGLTEQFDMDGSYPFTRMLEDYLEGKNDSWAIRWHATAFVEGALTLYPGRSLVWNAGLDGSGTHSGDLQLHLQAISASPVIVRPIPLSESVIGRAAFARYLRGVKRKRLLHRIRRGTSWVQDRIRRTP